MPTTRGSAVILLQPVRVAAPRPQGFADIDSLVEAQESDPASRAAIEQGRRVVAEQYYSKTPKGLAALRLGRGWSQKELARHLGTSQSYVARLEAGGLDPQLSTTRRLAAVFGVNAAEMLDALPRGKPA